MTLTSVAGLLSLLEDDRQDVQGFALTRLTDLVGEFWAEIFERATKLEDLIKDYSFKYKNNAALLASKVFFYSGSYEEALHYALCAQELFDINASTEFTDTLVSKCIDKYIELRLTNESSNDRENYNKLEQVVNRMFERCFAHKQYRQALGMAIETRRMDMFKQAIILSPDCDGMLRYAYRVILTLIDSVHLRNQLLDILVRIYTTFPTPTDAINTCQCLLLIDAAEQAANILKTLILRSSEATLTAYQICFDIYENASQNYLLRLRTALRHNQKLKLLAKSAEPKEGSSNLKNPAEGAVSGTGESATAKATEEETGEMQSEADSTNVALSEADEETRRRLNNLLTILSGDKTVEFYLEFLIGNNKGENRVLECARDESRHSVTHMAATLANGMIYCGTAFDIFLRKNLSWLKKAINWAKFTAVSTLGVIHKGNERDALKMMTDYLPKDTSGSSGSVYIEGGCFYALGLIHANHGGSMIEYLLKQINNATAEPVRHGACLGLGLAAMGTGRDDVYEELKLKLHQDDAVTGEAAAIAMGLVMLGTGSTAAVEDLWTYAKDTAHEKIIRGIALGIAMVMYGRLEEADTLINSLVVSNDPILRWCGMATIAMAYCGTGNNGAVQKLLHAAVSDTNDDVRRWAVTALGFILFKTPEQVPIAVSLLTESYHPHVQYGAAMAMGIGCAGTAMKEAHHLLETLCDGSVPFVRQGALIASALVLIQQNGITCPKSVEFREKCVKIITDRHEDLLTKFGAILACGILDAGGGNMTVSLQTRTGNNNMMAVVGLLVFQNYWFWYPLTNFMSLAFSPTALIALNKDLKMPVMQFRSNAKPQTFAHPKGYQPEKEKKKEKVETAVLSITAKQRKKEADRRQHREQQRKDSTTTSSTAGTSKTASKTVAPIRDEKMDVDPEPNKAKRSERKEEKEQNFKMLNNPARVMWAQQRVMSIPESSRYHTIKPVIQSGILMVVDGRPDESERLVESKRVYGAAAGSSSASAVGVAGAVEEAARVYAVDIGACVDSSEEEDDDEEGEDEEASTESPDVHMAEPGQRAATGKRTQSGKQSQIAVKPPEAFQYPEGGSQSSGGAGSSSSSTAAADAEAAGSSEKNPPSKDEEGGKK